MRSKDLWMQRYEYLGINRSVDVQILKLVDPWMWRSYILESEDLKICACRDLKMRGSMDL